MAAKRREYGSGSIYPNQDGTFTAAVRINGKIIRRRAPSREAGKAKIAELLKEREASNQHIGRLDGLVTAIELWWQRLPKDEQPRYRILIDARLRPVIDDLRALNADHMDAEAHAQTLKAWLTEWFNDVLANRNIKARTIEHYTSMLERYILPELGHLRLYEVNAAVIQRFVTNLRVEIAADGRYDGIRTARGAFGVLRDALKIAVQRGYLSRHPCDGVMLPPYNAKPIEPLSDDQLRRFITVAGESRYPALWYMYALMGLRRGEGLGLVWAGVNWTERTISVVQQVQHIEGSGPQFETPKSSAGKRILPLPDLVYTALLTLYESIPPAQRMGLIFPSTAGTLIWPTNLEKTFTRLHELSQLAEETTLHHLRHTVATLLDEVGASEALKAGVLGHGKEGITQKYTHARIEAMRRVIMAVEERIIDTPLDKIAIR